MRTAIRHVLAVKGSIFGFLAAFGLSFLSFGYLSLLLYLAAFPVLNLFFPPLGSWRGPWVWPVLVGTSILWSFSFLVAGIITRILEVKAYSTAKRRLVYLGVLWVGATTAWLFMLQTNMPGDGLGR